MLATGGLFGDRRGLKAREKRAPAQWDRERGGLESGVALPTLSLQAVSPHSVMVAVSRAEGAWLMPLQSLSPCALMMELPRGILQPQPQALFYPFFDFWCNWH